ncbi:hypothetical protein EYF80_016091 [Liparis tanakae]|uniref:Uncharacterized protein n=1 Tax=Liparis tanakae TaxID=230148 RepID=A0A4Z2I7F9_9TELE|nr:hypothetical protein EYF80_016091 [Liparis tanakae]
MLDRKCKASVSELRRLSVALLPLDALLLLLLGLRGQHKLLRDLLLRDELGDGTGLPDPGRGGGAGRGVGVRIQQNVSGFRLSIALFHFAAPPPISRSNSADVSPSSVKLAA